MLDVDMNLNFLQIATLVIALIALVLSVLNYYKDRSNIQAWAGIIWHQRGSDLVSETPRLRLRIVNLGRRPANLTHLVMKNSAGQWMKPLTDPSSESMTPLEFDEAIRVLERHSLIQNSALKLSEGDAQDVNFWPEDAQHVFMDWHHDSVSTATSLYVEDVSGKKYRVKNDVKCLKEILG
jgi:hypothetical protein